MRALFSETIVTLLSLFPLVLFLVGLLRRFVSMLSLASAPFFSRYRLSDVLVVAVSSFLDSEMISPRDYSMFILWKYILFLFIKLACENRVFNKNSNFFSLYYSTCTTYIYFTIHAVYILVLSINWQFIGKWRSRKPLFLWDTIS